jgi:hypothetical protein
MDPFFRDCPFRERGEGRTVETPAHPAGPGGRHMIVRLIASTGDLNRTGILGGSDP